ncbi:methyl-accepting chemotaxis protein [Chitinibacter sp. GC72]|uniref:methyl-accepting chemotaxis protein n=1 Tax=Chitinibacter sp. GC72 TaxID=1526917 RepID=UPI0012F9C83C|nr:methyl-accepting chemotaxis protein [Chitinibacter sp. GC72]
MRNNQPVTHTEYHLDEKQPIVTKTDLSGNITYANPAFIKISGYRKEELIGQPHNIVRHPDMPLEAFADLWHTIKAGLPWRGLVKNRSKDGGFYWVDAYVSPLTENGRKVGYMSVRSKPSTAQIRAAEQLYQSVKSGQQGFPNTRYTHQSALSLRLIVAAIVPSLLALGGHLLNAPYWGLAAALLTSSALLWWICTAIKAPIAQLETALEKLGEGDFKFELDNHAAQEFHRLLMAMHSTKVNLRAIMADVVSSSATVDRETDELKLEVDRVVGRFQQNSDGIASVAATLEELTVSVSEIADATERSSEYAASTLELANHGMQSMKHTLATSQQFENQMRQAQKEIGQLTSEINSIQQMSQTIKDVAAQTNLLALNAAIEAARAGEQGRGFAVVADEVRHLAERTTSSTQGIEALSERVLAQSRTAYEVMNQVMVQMLDNNRLIESNHQDLANINRSAQGVASSAGDIARMLEQQKQAASEVAVNMEKMSALTDQNNESVHIIGTASTQMASTASALNALVKHFEQSL